jgi:hypothetical protein
MGVFGFLAAKPDRARQFQAAMSERTAAFARCSHLTALIADFPEFHPPVRCDTQEFARDGAKWIASCLDVLLVVVQLVTQDRRQPGDRKPGDASAMSY